MIPLFKTHYSVGKSILTLENSNNEGGSDGVFDIAKEHGLDRVVFVEDDLIGFLETKKVAAKYDIDFVFGLRLKCCSSKSEDCVYKLIVFAKNDKGCRLLNHIYSTSFCDHDGILPLSELRRLWSEDDLKLCIPFYDSFLHNNIMTFSSCVVDFDFTQPTFFYEDNELPYDHIVFKKVKEYCEENNYHLERVKSIFYKNREDFEAYQTYKIVCNRVFGKARTLETPNLEHMGSSEFCFESYLDTL